VGQAIARQPRDALVARLVAAGVPVAPVLDRQGMLATAPFPRFPIRLPLPEATRPVPTLDQHRGQGFGDPAGA
jgi:crotonobetainyl-CoA:carnitine CoA-transferase CaiB-like acyl-CoA transferase